MHNLRQLTCIPAHHLVNVVRAKSGRRGDRLTAMLPDLRVSYAGFENAYTAGNLSGVAAGMWSYQQRQDLLHCYDVTTKALEALKQMIIALQDEGRRDLCPYCGIGAPRQFDHYVPKEQYPEYSVHAHNLVPSCGICNGKKSHIWLDANNQRLFINFYIDSLPTSPLLKITTHWVEKNGKRVPTVTFDIARPRYFRLASFGIIKSHFERLDLLDRYKDQAHSEFLMLRAAAIARKAKSTNVLRSFLEDFLKQLEEVLGPLNWKIALYKSLILDDLFLSECLNQ